MEIKEWRRLAVQSISLLLVVFACCICFAGRMQEKSGIIVKAEEKPQRENVAKEADEKTGTIAETKEDNEKTEESFDSVVVIDAGHGGMDEGTSSANGKYLEKDYTLLVVKRLQKFLEGQNIKVYYTRMDDTEVSKKKRTKLANQVEADLFISIHCNASSVGDTTAYGMETLYSRRKNGNQSMTNKELAQIMLEELTQATGMRKRGTIQREQLYLLHHSDVPTTIIEIGYMSNKKDMNFIKKENGQIKIAQGIFNGIMRALEE